MSCRIRWPSYAAKTSASRSNSRITDEGEQVAAATAPSILMILHTFSDGGARGNPGPAAIGYVILSASGKVLREGAECVGEMTNNKAEYRAMMKALEHARDLKGTKLLCHADSELL